ncbi:MAG: hypothetical protein ACYDHD_08100 [Vulcanimicrobiaceae bacterium]
MTKGRALWSAVLAASVLAGPSMALPAMAAPPSSPAERGSAAHGPAQGTLHGRIASIDYARATLVVDTAHGPVSVALLPSTNIFARKHGYATLADLRPGVHVTISTSRVNGHLVAEIVRLQ